MTDPSDPPEGFGAELLQFCVGVGALIAALAILAG